MKPDWYSWDKSHLVIMHYIVGISSWKIISNVSDFIIAAGIISLLILIVSIPFTFKICAPIFKNGILDYTKKKKDAPKTDG